ncbi:MAG: DMT family transporter [Bacillota bacterium]
MSTLSINVYWLLGMAVLFNALANIVIKWAMQGKSVLFAEGLGTTVKNLAANYWLWGGIILFGLAFILYSLVLARINLSIAYPVMTSLGLVIITLVSILVFKEVITGLQAGGLLLIIIGVWLVSFGN